MKATEAQTHQRGVLWVVGASSGIGRCLVQQLAAAGWRVAASARSEERLDQLAASAGQASVRSYPLDVTDSAAVAARRALASLAFITSMRRRNLAIVSSPIPPASGSR